MHNDVEDKNSSGNASDDTTKICVYIFFKKISNVHVVVPDLLPLGLLLLEPLQLLFLLCTLLPPFVDVLLQLLVELTLLGLLSGLQEVAVSPEAIKSKEVSVMGSVRPIWAV